jgi:hypothetical protein
VLRKLLRTLLVILDAFLALTAIAGGIGLLTDLNAPPVTDLAGSPFSDYTIPGLALLVIVGGAAVVATLMMLRNHPNAAPASGASGVAIVFFEIIEVLVIGSPPGIARNLQIFYFTLGLIIIVFASAQWSIQRRATLEG